MPSKGAERSILLDVTLRRAVFRVVDPDEGIGNRGDREKDAVAGPLVETGPDLSAEEAAMHVEDSDEGT